MQSIENSFKGELGVEVEDDICKLNTEPDNDEKFQSEIRPLEAGASSNSKSILPHFKNSIR